MQFEKNSHSPLKKTIQIKNLECKINRQFYQYKPLLMRY